MAAQNKLGELFVDIGVGGLGKTLKGLNSVSASFLLTKNAAVQMTKPIVDMTKKFGENAIGVRKMTVAFKGMTDDMSQRIQALSKIKSLNNLVPALSKIQQEYSNMASGLPVDNNFTKGLHKLHLSMSNYTNDAQGYLNLLSDMQEAISTMDTSEIEGAFKFLSGFDWAEMLYARGQVVDYSNIPTLANALTKEEIDTAIKGQEELNRLQIKVFTAMQKIFVENETPIINMFNKLGQFADKAPKWIDKHLKEIKEYLILFVSGMVGYWAGGRAGALGAIAGSKAALIKNKNSLSQSVPKKTSNSKPTVSIATPLTPEEQALWDSVSKKSGNNQQIEYRPDLDLRGRSDLPSDVPTNQIGAINFNIYSDNADEISNRVNNNLDNVLNSSRYYQTIV